MLAVDQRSGILNITNQELGLYQQLIHSISKSVPVSAFDSKVDESPDHIMQPPQMMSAQPQQLLMDTGDWRLAQCLKNSIETIQQNNQSVNVEDLISKVKFENSRQTPSPQQSQFVNMRKRQSLILESNRGLQ